MKLSILILDFLKAEKIAKNLSSILSQKTNFNFEILIGDNSCDQKNRAILENLAPKNWREILNEKNFVENFENNFLKNGEKNLKFKNKNAKISENNFLENSENFLKNENLDEKKMEKIAEFLKNKKKLTRKFCKKILKLKKKLRKKLAKI